MEEVKEEVKQEVDEKGVPLNNRFKELERKLEEKYAKELEQTRRELSELKVMNQSRVQTQDNPEVLAQQELQEFVKNPSQYIDSKVSAREFQRQVPEAEAWLRMQNGYSQDTRTRIDQIIFENKLNTPFHTPMERAKTAWRFLQAENIEKDIESRNDEARREAVTGKTGGEGKGKNVPKSDVNTHNELIKKLAAAEAKGDMDASIRIMDMLQDHPSANSVVRGM